MILENSKNNESVFAECVERTFKDFLKLLFWLNIICFIAQFVLAYLLNDSGRSFFGTLMSSFFNLGVAMWINPWRKD